MKCSLVSRTVVAAVGLAMMSYLSTSAVAADWTYWRGPDQNGTSRETGLPDDWDPAGGEGSNLKWKREDLGTRSTPIVMKGRLYLLCRDQPETTREGEKVVCVDAATGQTLWEHAFNVWLSDVPDTRVGWSSVVGDPETGNVYALGVCGYFACLDGVTGEMKWSKALHEEYGLLSTYGGRTNFPILFEDLVITSAVMINWGAYARPAHRVLAMDKRTGEPVWFSGTRQLPEDTTYSAPVIAMLGGQAAMVFGSGDGAVWAMQPRTGRPIWNYDFSLRGLNTSPTVVDQTVFIGHSEENIAGTAMGAIAAIDGSLTGDITKTGQKWKVEETMVGKTSIIHLDGRLYCLDDRAKLHVLDAETGQPVVRQIALGTVQRSSPLYADGKFYIVTNNGRWYILKPDADKGAVIISRGSLNAEADASPIAAGGRVFIAVDNCLYCLEDETKAKTISPAPAALAEPPASEDQTPAHVQISPAEGLIRPGDAVQYRVRLFNRRGQFLKESPAEFSIAGPGQIDAAGRYLSADARGHEAVIVTAKVGELSGQARLRIVPPLPWSFNFDDTALNPATQLGEPPITWVGARYRHVIREVDGSKVMVKVSTIPKGTRSRSWFGQSDLKEYTIQADVKGQRANDKQPDIGLINMGYTLDLMGLHQKLQIRLWDPQLERMSATVDFPWEAEKWYTMKMKTTIEDGQAVVLGKVWPRGAAEPAEWTIRAVDEAPNLQGSPGLFGNATLGEIYLDNIRVFANDDS